MKRKNALIVVDVQRDFLPGGSLAVPDGDKVIPVINELLSKFDLIIFTQDWHPENHKSFASQHEGKQVFDTIMLNGQSQVLWPDHCVQYTPGAEITPDIKLGKCKKDFYVFKKGMGPEVDSYSAFYDNGRANSTELSEFLTAWGVTNVYVVGLALDYCVAYTAIDAALEGFKTCVIEDATKAISPDINDVLKQFNEAGVDFIQTWELDMYNLTK